MVCTKYALLQVILRKVLQEREISNTIKQDGNHNLLTRVCDAKKKGK